MPRNYFPVGNYLSWRKQHRLKGRQYKEYLAFGESTS